MMSVKNHQHAATNLVDTALKQTQSFTHVYLTKVLINQEIFQQLLNISELNSSTS